MEIKPNASQAEIMHIDLNSAFAMTEQQANPLLRGRPVGITNRLNQWSICITSSYEAKRQGVVIGTRWRDAMIMAPGFVMLESDPAKYTFVHQKLRTLFASYSPVAYMKSIDEGIIDFSGMKTILKGRPLQDIATEIKARIADEIGDYMTVNIGIGTNRWLAKVAASFMKPNGLYTIDHTNLEVVYGLMDLLDLPYISYRNQARLAAADIYTPLEFYRAPERVLTKQVFKSIMGHHWYLKLRGYETEVEYGIQSVSRSYVLEHRTNDPEEMSTLLYKASVKLSRRLAKVGLASRGLMLGLGFAKPYGGWLKRQMHQTATRRADQIYRRAQALYWYAPPNIVSGLFLTCYALEPARTNQPTLFEDEHARRERLEDAINAINDRYGELVTQPASVAKSKNPMKDKIPFGSIRYFD